MREEGIVRSFGAMNVKFFNFHFMNARIVPLLLMMIVVINDGRPANNKPELYITERISFWWDGTAVSWRSLSSSWLSFLTVGG